MFDRILAYLERLATAYPEAFGMLVVLIVVPAIGSALSFADGWAAKRWPVAVALLRAALPDPKRMAAILVAKAFESRKLPVPPEVRQLTVERVEKAIEATSSRPSRIPPGITGALLTLVVCVVIASLTGCADLTWARSIRDASHDAAVLAAPVVERYCVVQAEADLATIRAELDPAKREKLAEEAQMRLRARRCTEAVSAYDALRVASITLDATVAAAESGRCMSARSEGCDVGGAAVKAAQATAAVATFVRGLEAGK